MMMTNKVLIFMIKQIKVLLKAIKPSLSVFYVSVVLRKGAKKAVHVRVLVF